MKCRNLKIFIRSRIIIFQNVRILQKFCHPLEAIRLILVRAMYNYFYIIRYETPCRLNFKVGQEKEGKQGKVFYSRLGNFQKKNWSNLDQTNQFQKRSFILGLLLSLGRESRESRVKQGRGSGDPIFFLAYFNEKVQLSFYAESLCSRLPRSW